MPRKSMWPKIDLRGESLYEVDCKLQGVTGKANLLVRRPSEGGWAISETLKTPSGDEIPSTMMKDPSGKNPTAGV